MRGTVIVKNTGNRNVKLSIREAMIFVSEVMCKEKFGLDYFGVARANSVRHAEVIVDGSTGFVEELPPLIEKLGQENILLIRVHRNGCTYDGDSRNYIPDGVIHNTIDIDNNSSLGGYFNQVEEAVQKFLGVKSE